MYIIHSGVLGQKWGVRKYQYTDGSLTPLGRKHYGVGPPNGESKDGTGGNKPKSVDQSPKKSKAELRAEKKAAKKALRERKAKIRAIKAEKRAQKEKERKAATIAKNKEKWSKDPVSVHKHKEAFTTEELQQLNKRFDQEDSIYAKNRARLTRGADYINDFVKWGKAVKSVDDLIGKPGQKWLKKTVKNKWGVDLDFSKEKEDDKKKKK